MNTSKYYYDSKRKFCKIGLTAKCFDSVKIAQKRAPVDKMGCFKGNLSVQEGKIKTDLHNTEQHLLFSVQSNYFKTIQIFFSL